MESHLHRITAEMRGHQTIRMLADDVEWIRPLRDVTTLDDTHERHDDPGAMVLIATRRCDDPAINRRIDRAVAALDAVLKDMDDAAHAEDDNEG